ncbi:hypothetical protein BT96DRAFT_1019280 [Gymnopus androsaceus JB14]|uniref:Fungal-type protein kinase domain-containing protein n=1 Tax=Gymnopus androsaceus JB14 TaxID=1447944 RepID=A0A6A4HQ47_9AGAR|nr:hypothetical protein BT96DRAFT_1019280 [Gymnopus androsaceus JB14]
MIPEISLDDYFTHILPPLPESLNGKVDAIVQNLKDSGVITPRGRWKGFPRNPKAFEKKTVVFKKLSEIFDAFFVEPNIVSHHQRGDKSRPDGFVKEKNTEGKLKVEPTHAWVDLAHPQEFKLEDDPSGVDNDASKVVYSMHQILALDPRRRFTTGSTIENCTTRLWFYNRSPFFTTESFDFIKDHERLVHLYLSLAFSSSTDSGWEPSIKVSRVDPVTRERTYEISVSTKQGDKVVTETYKTVMILSEVSTDDMGRAARIWLVVDSNGYYRVLKDLWLDKNRAPEHEIRQEILRDVFKTQNQAAVDRLKSHMLTPLAHCKVCIEGVEDDTIAVMMLFQLKVVGALSPQTAESVSQSLNSQPPPNSQHESKEARAPKVHARYHYRIVFAEYATTIYDERNLGNIFRSVEDVLCALVQATSTGMRQSQGVSWVTLSMPNSALIPSAHEIRTGTPYFMAAEALSHAYLFQSQPLPTTIRLPFRLDCQPQRDDDSIINDEALALAPAPPFIYNGLHDLESIWWILIFVLFFNEDKAHPSPRPEERQSEMNHRFNGRMDSTYRRDFFRIKFSEKFDAVSRFMSPSFRQSLCTLLSLSQSLQEAYTLSEKDYPDINDSPEIIPYMEWRTAVKSESLLKATSMIELHHVKARAQASFDSPTSGAGRKRERGGDLELLDEQKSKKSKWARDDSGRSRNNVNAE